MFGNFDLKKNNKKGCNKCLENIISIFEEVEIINHLQPIISVTKNTVIGYESLCRGLCKNCRRIIQPLELFSKLKDEKELFELDLRARFKAIEFFDKALSKNKEHLLFFNFDANLIEKKIDSSETLLDFCKNTKVRANNIVIEITESKPCKLDRLMNFVEECRKYGFLIALDDVGTGYSNFDRISAIKPDIIKLDRSIIENLDKDYHKKVIFRSMSRLAGKMGILLLAEGVETEDEVLYSLELGADLLQGFYFARPEEINPDFQPTLEKELSYIENVYRDYKIDRIKVLRENHKIYDETLNLISGALLEKEETEFDELLANYVDKHEFIESLYIINEKGVQVTDSYLNYNLCKIKPKIYKIFKKGDSHYYKEYFYLLQERILDKFTTDTYFSYITGGLCKTISLSFTSKNQEKYVLCMNIKE